MPLLALEDAQKLLFSSPTGLWECSFSTDKGKHKVTIKDNPEAQGTALRFYEETENAPASDRSVDSILSELRLVLQQTLSPVVGGLRIQNKLDTDPQPLIDECIDDVILRLDANIINR